MKTLHYILNEKTDYSFDANEMMFFSNTWEPELDEDKIYLQRLIDDNPVKFKDCIIISQTFET